MFNASENNPNPAAVIDPLCSSDSVWVGTDVTRSVTDELNTLQSSKANSDHTHAGYAAEDHTHTGFAASDHAHTGYAAEGHAHTGYATSDHTHSASDVGAAAENHSHSEYASASHSHTGYASSSHSHSEYASSDHTHSGYASSSHNHDSDYLPASGDVDVNGVLRVQGQQAFYYNSSSGSQTIGSGNAASTTIANGASSTTAINGNLVKVPTLVPKTTNAYYCGNANFRWKGIYSSAAVNVSSDKRLKRDVSPCNVTPLANFIDNLEVVSFNYKNDSEDEKPRIGLIAQAVQDVDGEIAKFFVSEDETGMLGLTTADLVFPLIAAVQKLKDEVDQLKSML